MTVRNSQTQSPFGNLKLTRAAKIILAVVLVTSIGYLLCGLETRFKILEWTMPTGSSVWRSGRVWTLITGPLLEVDIVWLVLLTFMLLSLPQLESFWGTNRMLRFVAFTGLAGSIGGTLVGLIIGSDRGVLGVAPVGFALQIAFGVVYINQPMRLFGAIQITGRQMVYGTLAVVVLFVVLQSLWVQGGAFAGSIGMAFWLTSRRHNPRVLWTRWQLRRSRSHLSLVPRGSGGSGATPPRGGSGKKPAKTNERYLN
jgi:hypothetical protein